MSPFISLQRLFTEEQPSAMFLGLETPTRLKSILIGLAVGSGLFGFLFAIIKPENASNLLFVQSWAFWSLHGFVGFGFIVLAELVLLKTSWRRLSRLAATLAILPFVLAPFSIVLDGSFFAVDLDDTYHATAAETYLSEVVDIAPLSIVMTGIGIWISRYWRPVSKSKTSAVDTGRPDKNLYECLEGCPASLGNDVVRLEAQDHYTKVVTTRGYHLLSKSLQESISALEHFEGTQTHRSHWLNIRHAVAMYRIGSAFECELSNGDRVPVSRRRYSVLRHMLLAEIEKRNLEIGLPGVRVGQAPTHRYDP